MERRLSSVLLLNFVLVACTSVQRPALPEHEQPVQNCRAFISASEDTIRTANVIDAEARRIPGYPYLRTNRFLSDFRFDELHELAFNDWVKHLLALSIEGWRIELANLPEADRKHLTRLSSQLHFPDARRKELTIDEALQLCADVLIAAELDETDERENLRSKARTPDEYNTWQRIIGLYPISALAFRSGIARWHEATRDTYALALSELPVSGQLNLYTPDVGSQQLNPSNLSQIIKASSHNSLGIPQPGHDETKQLFDYFAPIFEIDVVTDDDRPGSVTLDKNAQVSIDIHSPKVYRHVSYTRVDSKILLQLNYSIWFPARPMTSNFDLLGGHLDGITWRVTLLPDGQPWLYDSIHNCGCYHLVYPTPNAEIINQPAAFPLFDEPLLIPQIIQEASSLSHQVHTENHRPILRIAHGTHYIERVYFTSHKPIHVSNYSLADSDELRSLQLSGGERQSLFGQDGLIKSSQRNERFLFWPMGIPSPGAMRQWGHHATAFVGRRHFDDARLFEPYFAIRTGVN